MSTSLYIPGLFVVIGGLKAAERRCLGFYGEVFLGKK
jgi:hypothetical protein